MTMKPSFKIVIQIIIFSAITQCVYAGLGTGFEFSKSQMASMEYYNDYSRTYNGCSYITSTNLEIIPDECRFYLHYNNSGKSNVDLLAEAERIKDLISDLLKKIDEENIFIEMVSYNPEKYLGSIFRSEKEEISLQYRIIVKLEKDFWSNSKKIAQVLDVINKVKTDQKLDKNITQGDVRYAVKDVQPYVKDLLNMTREKIELLKKSIQQISAIPENELFFHIDFGEIYVQEQTLEKVILVLPYSFSYDLKDTGENPEISDVRDDGDLP